MRNLSKENPEDIIMTGSAYMGGRRRKSGRFVKEHI